MQRGQEQRVVKWFKDREQWREEVEISNKISEKVGEEASQHFVLVEWSGESENLAKISYF